MFFPPLSLLYSLCRLSGVCSLTLPVCLRQRASASEESTRLRPAPRDLPYRPRTVLSSADPENSRRRSHEDYNYQPPPQRTGKTAKEKAAEVCITSRDTWQAVSLLRVQRTNLRHLTNLNLVFYLVQDKNLVKTLGWTAKVRQDVSSTPLP